LRNAVGKTFWGGPGEGADAPTRDRGFGLRCVAAAAVLWSLGGVVTKLLELGPLPIAFYRSLFAGLVLLPLVPRARWQWRGALVPLGLAFGAMTGLFIGAVKATTAANAIYLQYTATFWMIPLGGWLLGEKPDRRSLMGVALALVGIAVIVGWGYDGRPGEPVGIVLGLASGLAYACVAVLFRRLRQLDPLWLSSVANLGAALALGAGMVVAQGTIPVPGHKTMAVLVGFGVFQMAVPYVLFALGLRTITAIEAGLLALIEPLLNPVWVAIFHGEQPAPATLIGGLLLLAGLLCRLLPKGVDVRDQGEKE
jgi:drug/metabolite transporter, DME family